MTKGLISVIIPCYNVENFIDDCFLSLDNQTYKNIEMIFVNDGSKDGTLQKIKQFCEGKSNCKIVDQQNQGVSFARNNGLKTAEGEFVCFVDADDFLSPNFIEVLHKNLTVNDSDFSSVQMKMVNESFSYKNIPQKHEKKHKKIIRPAENIMCYLFSGRDFMPNACNKLYKMDLIKKMETFPNVFNKEIKYGEDVDFNLRYFRNVNKTIIAYDKLYFYRQRKGSAMHSKFNENRFTILKGVDEALQYAQKQNYAEVAKYAKASKCVPCMEILFSMYKSKYDNSEKIVETFNLLKENAKLLRKCKLMPGYRKYFGFLTVPFFKILFHKQIKMQYKKEKP